MSLLERSSEELARQIDRRRFLRRAAVTVFSIATAAAVNLIPHSTASAAYCPVINAETGSGNCQCDFPNGECAGCNGLSYNCPSGCTRDTSTWGQPHPNGCWCSAICGSCFQYYYVCCDCKCSGSPCGCSEYFSYPGAGPNC